MNTPSRRQVRQDLNHIAQIGVVAILGRVPRRERRRAGRIYGNCSWRIMQGLPAVKADTKANTAMCSWIIKEYNGVQEQLKKETDASTVSEVQAG